MSHFSPQVFLLWAILTVSLAVFYVHHLWHFDRFHCLKVFRKPHKAKFTRFMTFSYLMAVPLLLTYTVGFAVIKYKAGYITLPSGSVVPKPYEQWIPQHQGANFPLNIIFALAWGTEIVSHLEELCFWFFLIRSGPSPVSWFKSVYFKIWACGSITALALVPAVTAVTKNDNLKNEAWLQFVGSTIDLIITFGFLPVLWVFPGFVQKARNEGADKAAIIRLVKFHNLNITRTAFRFLFVVPFTLLSIDGLQPHIHHLNENALWTDLLGMASGIGCMVQSAITLLIFFPRDVELETRRWLREPSAKPRIFSGKPSKVSNDLSTTGHNHRSYLRTDSPVPGDSLLPYTPSTSDYTKIVSLKYDDQARLSSPSLNETYSMTSLDQQGLWNDTNALKLTGVVRPEVTRTLNPMTNFFISPINIDLPDFPPRL